MTKNEKLVNEIIKRYGPTIDMKANPHLIVEIVRNFKARFDEIPDGGLPCGGVPPSPPPGPSSLGRKVDLVTLVSKLVSKVEKLDKKLDKAIVSKGSAVAKKK